MNKLYSDVNTGRKNILFGVTLFLILGIAVGIPLTVDFLGGSMLTTTQYQTWKVIHGYGVFLAFVNFFFGYSIDRLNLSRRQKEISSWSFLVAGLVGGLGRSAMFLFSIQCDLGSYVVSLVETLGFIIGTFIFVRGLFKAHAAQRIEQPAPAVS